MQAIFLIFSLFIMSAMGACGKGNSSDSSSNSPSSTAPGEAAGMEQTQPLTLAEPDTSLSVAYFAGGCFWCTEASFERIEGVQAVISGYSGGKERNPTYEQVSRGATAHAEAIAIYYDSSRIDFPTLLDVFFVAHDPTQLNRQGPDVGPQYRSAIFYRNPQELKLAQEAIDQLNKEGVYSQPVVTELSAFEKFYPAEAYHQGYYELHPNQSYVANVSRPKVEKVEKRFAAILKEPYRKK